MLTIHTESLTARQLHHLGPLLPADTTYAPQHTIALNPADCPNRGALIAWLNAAAPLYWYDGTIVPVEQRHIFTGRPGRACSCALALALADATGEQWDVGPTRCHTFPTTARTWYVPYTLSAAARYFVQRFDHEPRELINPMTFVLRLSGSSVVSRGPRPTLDLYCPGPECGHA